MKNNRLLKTALSILGYEVIFGVAGLLLTSSLSAASAALRMPLVGLIIAAAWALVALGGAAQGETDYTMTETLDKLAKKNGYVPSADEKAKRFSRGRAVLGAALGGLLLFAAALCVAVEASARRCGALYARLAVLAVLGVGCGCGRTVRRSGGLWLRGRGLASCGARGACWSRC